MDDLGYQMDEATKGLKANEDLNLDLEYHLVLISYSSDLDEHQLSSR